MGYESPYFTSLSRYLPAPAYGRLPMNMVNPALGSPYAPLAAADVPYLPSKAELDGTNAFGLNSVPGAYALSTMPAAAQPPGLFAGMGDSLGGIMKSFVGDKENPGWGMPVVGSAAALMGGYLGMKQYGLAKDALAENKRQWQLQYDAQKALTNTQLEDRQRARVASNPGAYQSVGTYMNQNGLK